MKKTITTLMLSAVLSAGLAVSAPSAQAGQATENLSNCLVASMTEADRKVLVTWIFGVMAQHPDVASMANLPPEKFTAINQQAGILFTRFMTDDCGAETRLALKADGDKAVSAAFEVLGAKAMEDLMSHPKVMGSIQEMVTFVDLNKLAQVLYAPQK